MNDRRTQIIADLEKNREDALAFFRSLSPHEWGIRVYQDGAEWTVPQEEMHNVLQNECGRKSGPSLPESHQMDLTQK